MLEINSWEDIELIQDENIKKYMLHTKQRATQQQKPWDFENWGYWLILDYWEELNQPIKVKHFTLPNLEEGLLNQLELYEEKLGVCELVYLVDTDFSVGLIVLKEKLPIIDILHLKEMTNVFSRNNNCS